MYRGRIVEMGTTDAIYERAEHAYTRALLSAVPQPDPGAPTARLELDRDVDQAGRGFTGDRPRPLGRGVDARHNSGVEIDSGVVVYSETVAGST